MLQSMKKNRLVAPLVPLFACVVICGMAPAARADEECTLEALKGNFGGSSWEQRRSTGNEGRPLREQRAQRAAVDAAGARAGFTGTSQLRSTAFQWASVI